MPALHDDELDVDRQLVRQLVERSLPQYAGLSIRLLASSGSTNSLFRLGDALLVRLPRQPGGSLAIEKGARWLPVIAPGLTTAVPEVVAVGDPGFGYPEKWAVTTWLDGRVPAVAWEVLDPGGRETFGGEVGIDDVAWTKSMGWALLVAMITFPYYWTTMPARCAARRSMAAAVLAEG